MNKFLITFNVFALLPAGFAEDIVRFPSGPATWTITCELRTGGNAADSVQERSTSGMNESPGLEKIEVAQTETARRTILYWSKEKKREIWSLPKLEFFLTEDSTGTAFTTRNAISFGDPFGPSNFDWIRSGAKKSPHPVQFAGMECTHYEGAISIPSLSRANASESISCQAWIEVNTLLPVALLKGNLLGKFKFGPPPGNLEMPEKFRDTLEYHRMVMGSP